MNNKNKKKAYVIKFNKSKIKNINSIKFQNAKHFKISQNKLFRLDMVAKVLSLLTSKKNISYKGGVEHQDSAILKSIIHKLRHFIL